MISEVDIADWERMPVTPLYSVENKTYVYVPEWDSTVFFDHIDGMYSFCMDMENNIVHLAAWTEVQPLRKVSK
jgi:hypothetical protein